MGTAWSYNSDPNDEHDAIRERVGMFDMSPLKKVNVIGTDAAAVLDHATSRDIKRIKPGRSAYLSVLTDAGTMADDAIVYNHGDDNWMIVHGSGDTMAMLEASAAGKNVSIGLDDDLHDIEAGLLFYGYDMTDAHTPWEIGLGFTVNERKGEFRGKDALLKAKGHEKIKNVTLIVDHSDMVNGGETLTHNGQQVGVMNSPCYSHRLSQSLALAHVAAHTAASGTQLEVAGENLQTTAQICDTPIFDNEKARTHE